MPTWSRTCSSSRPTRRISSSKPSRPRAVPRRPILSWLWCRAEWPSSSVALPRLTSVIIWSERVEEEEAGKSGMTVVFGASNRHSGAQWRRITLPSPFSTTCQPCIILSLSLGVWSCPSDICRDCRGILYILNRLFWVCSKKLAH